MRFKPATEATNISLIMICGAAHKSTLAVAAGWEAPTQPIAEASPQRRRNLRRLRRGGSQSCLVHEGLSPREDRSEAAE
jgi:hypothetical protein